MPELARRRSYAYHRVLIDSTRLLDPQFDPVTLTATGAQVEMLRNLMQYLNRLSSYVAQTEPDYYLTPTIEDYDTIHAMVADLEYKLMNGGIPVSDYGERFSEWLGTTMSADEDFEAQMDAVPEGKVLVVEYIYLRNTTGNRGDAELMISDAVQDYMLHFEFALVEENLARWDGSIHLEEGDYIKLFLESCLDGDVVEAGVWGYTFNAP